MNYNSQFRFLHLCADSPDDIQTLQGGSIASVCCRLGPYIPENLVSSHGLTLQRQNENIGLA